ncbi:MAG TPA: ABC transporter permease, partial [Mucilaginibacter sp.]|nr:ABC transporter permease [Mucilaginibacter sp.]
MFKNYLISAIRSLKRYKLFTLLNIFGLATGMACSILILLWVQDERSYDKFNANAPQIYRLIANISGVQAAVTPPPVAAGLKRQIPAIKNYARLDALHSVVTIGHQKFDEKNIFYADSTFLQMFNYPLLHGNKDNVLSRPDGVVITEATAKKYFGNQDAIGKVLRIDNDMNGNNYVVTGVLKDIPH